MVNPMVNRNNQDWFIRAGFETLVISAYDQIYHRFYHLKYTIPKQRLEFFSLSLRLPFMVTANRAQKPKAALRNITPPRDPRRLTRGKIRGAK